MPLPASRTVDALRIAHVHRLQHALQAVIGGRHCHQVDVIDHQAIRKNFDLELAAVLVKPGEIRHAIIFAEERILSTIAALGDVVGNATEDWAGLSWQSARIALKKCSVPFIRKTKTRRLRLGVRDSG
jgi:hypothetical protein